jgi:parallel beta-helix repeat protein
MGGNFMQKNGLIRKGIVVGILTLFLGISTSPLNAEILEKITTPTGLGDILYVGGGGPGNYSTIQEAINNASEGDTVYVFDDSSPYIENVVINIRINLIGENKETTVIDGNGSGNVVYISANEVEITGFTITHGTTGIYLDSSTENVTISRNIITENEVYGITFSGFCERNTIIENIISHNINGTYFSAGSYNEIYGNTFEENEWGIQFILWCNENRITRNNFIGNTRHVFFFTSSLNIWIFNYWDRPRILPKPLFGMLGIIPWIKFDWRPLLTPYVITD